MADRTHPTALIVGRFNPPHLGHSFMIDWAAERVERLVVFVNTRDGELVPGELRAGWLAELHPHVSVVEVRHDLDTNFDDEDLEHLQLLAEQVSRALQNARIYSGEVEEKPG